MRSWLEAAAKVVATITGNRSNVPHHYTVIPVKVDVMSPGYASEQPACAPSVVKEATKSAMEDGGRNDNRKVRRGGETQMKWGLNVYMLRMTAPMLVRKA